jgi:hypothetical protein
MSMVYVCMYVCMYYIYMHAQSKRKVKLMCMWHVFHWSIYFFRVEGRGLKHTYLA